MDLCDAKLRLKELTQELYNIGDEMADYIEHIEQSVADWDGDLVSHCLEEFAGIAHEAVHDSRLVTAELVGIRQALTSGLRSGTMSVWDAVPRVPLYHQPPLVDADTLAASHPLLEVNSVGDVDRALRARTASARQQLRTIVDWVLDQTACAASELYSVNLPTVYTRGRRLVVAVGVGWITTVAEENPSYTATMRGAHPPHFLAERAWIDAVVARVRARQGHTTAGAGG